MKKVLSLLILIIVASFTLHAQPWMQKFNNKSHVKLQDVIDEWKKDHQQEEDADKRDTGEEDDNYQFDRWVNYWKNHLDENGYMISPIATVREWRNYQQAQLNRGARTTGTATWTFQGPKQSYSDFKNGQGLGRITSVTYHPTDSETFWVGTAGGGVWKTTDDAHTWSCITDNYYPVRGVSDIAVNSLNPNTIYICTGDRDGGDCYSFGILKSYDGGTHWDTTGLVWQESIQQQANSLVINPVDTNTLLLATNSGIYRTLDGGKTFTIVQTGKFTQLLYDPADTSIVYAAGAYSGNIGVCRSNDGGATWSLLLHPAGIYRIAMAVTPQNPRIIKAIACNAAYGLEGVYSSSDWGNTFSRVYNADTGCSLNILNGDPKLKSTSCGGQGWYDLCIAINPQDSNSVYIGGVNTYHSTTGGSTWTIINQWTSSVTSLQVVHADKHYMGYNPLTPTVLYEGNDGGVWRTGKRAVPDTAPGYLYYDISDGLYITQFYRIAVADNANFVLGGAQDNGTKQQYGEDSTHQPGGADGMTCQIDYTNSNIIYYAIQYGSISRRIGTSVKNISDNISKPAPKGAWITPFALDPTNPDFIYAGFNKVYISPDQGNSWFPLALTLSGNIDILAIAPSDNQYIYLVAANVIRYTDDGGATWKIILNPFGGTITALAIDPVNAKHIWITYGGYTVNKAADYDPTNGWRLQNGSLPAIPANCITIDHDNGNVYIGTDVAVYYRDAYMTDWALYNNSLPVVEVRDLQINYATGEIWAGTYGRGLWKTAKAGPNVNVSIVPYADNIIKVYPNPNRGHITVSTDNSKLVNTTVTCRLINSLGQTVWQTNASFNGTKLEAEANGIPKGVYIFEITGKDIVARNRVVML